MTISSQSIKLFADVLNQTKKLDFRTYIYFFDFELMFVFQDRYRLCFLDCVMKISFNWSEKSNLYDTSSEQHVDIIIIHLNTKRNPIKKRII